MKNFFNLNQKYKFEYNDVRAVITFVNVILIIHFGITICYLNLIIAVIGIVKDLTIDKKINGLLMHSANVILNLYLIILLYK